MRPLFFRDRTGGNDVCEFGLSVCSTLGIGRTEISAIRQSLPQRDHSAHYVR